MKDYNLEIEKILSNQFKSSFMSNSKWYKLIEELTGSFDKLIVHYKLIYDDTIYQRCLMNAPDNFPFFQEPILYKEIEWIEFPLIYKDIQNKRTSRIYEKNEVQDINTVKSIIINLGAFMLETYEDKLRLYAYR